MSKITLDFFQDNLNNKIIDMCSNIKKNDELEVSFGSQAKPISLKKFNNLLKYINFRSKRDNLEKINNTQLDILYSYDPKSMSTYRLSINGIEQINDLIENNSLLKNHTIFSKQLRSYLNQDKNSNTNYIDFINKIKTSDKFIALDDYDIRIKYSEENSDINQSTMKTLMTLQESERHQISFRYKQRLSLKIIDNDDYTLSMDLTDVKNSNILSQLSGNISKYELEIDVSFKRAKISDKKISQMCNDIAENMHNLEKFIQESQMLITNTEISNVKKNLNKLAYDDENDSYKDLPAMQSASVELNHVIDIIPGNYTVTDKADGDRYFLMIYENNVYLLSTNLEVKKIKHLDEKHKSYNLTVLDGEYIFIPSKRKFTYLVFDILFFQGKDVRSEELLKNRLLLASKVLKDVFSVDMPIGIYSGDYNFNQITKFHETNIKNNLKQLNLLLEDKNTDNNIIVGKYFIFPMLVGQLYDIYALTVLCYESYAINSELKCPYVLDGCIYTPINQKYTRSVRDTKYKILKWKPEKNNSIDFYVMAERNPDTGKIITAYDRTNENALEDYVEKHKNSSDIDFNDMTDFKVNSSVYQIFNLYVGYMKNNQETPVLFQKENDNYQAFIFVKDGFPRDVEGNIIQDGTVVEFAYDNSADVPDRFRWIPLRTRFDKTESVMRFRRKYGNNSEIANRVWNSIQNPITFDDLKLLGDLKTNANHIKTLKSKISSETITMTRRDDQYYNLVTNLGKNLRNFHNWIKSNMIYTYCAKKTLLNSNKIAMDILDIGTGRGGDLMKLYHAKVKSAVCFDPNESSLSSGSDGAISRYNIFKKKYPGFPRMSFIVADGGQKLDYTNQLKVGKTNDQNIKLLKQTFGENESSTKHNTFDVFNAQFMIHYLLRDSNTWNNFCHNVNKYLRKDGYLLITTLDGLMVHQNFKDGHIMREYITDNGEKKVLFDLVKKYSDSIDLIKLKGDENLGLQIDAHIPMFMDEGVYQTEYLVNPSFMINELRSKCNMRLIETESFQNLYYVYRDFFNNTAQYESKQETRNFFDTVKQFYNLEDETTKNWFEYSRLNRYYIFQKK
jgi:SAM-dependent methyltransferase